MREAFHTFVGIDLGGTRGKTTAIARLSRSGRGVTVDEVCTRHRGHEPWTDEVLLELIDDLGEGAVVAIDAPLTVPACVRCTIDVCPGVEACEVPATIWLRTTGARMQADALMADLDRIAAIPTSSLTTRRSSTQPAFKQRLAPYTHRCTEVELHYQHDLVPREALGRGTGPIEARAAYLRRTLAHRGYHLNQNLLEVSPRATVHALFGEHKARGYKRDADPWETRAAIVEGLSDSMSFSPSSRLSREEVLRNDHCFEALLSGYTAFLWARDGWTMPEEGPFVEDGWIWAPPRRDQR